MYGWPLLEVERMHVRLKLIYVTAGAAAAACTPRISSSRQPTSHLHHWLHLCVFIFILFFLLRVKSDSVYRFQSNIYHLFLPERFSIRVCVFMWCSCVTFKGNRRVKCRTASTLWFDSSTFFFLFFLSFLPLLSFFHFSCLHPSCLPHFYFLSSHHLNHSFNSLPTLLYHLPLMNFAQLLLLFFTSSPFFFLFFPKNYKDLQLFNRFQGLLREVAG